MMPMASLFQPDVNFVSARNVYPTAQGGTVAGAGAAMSGSTNVQVSDGQGNTSVTTAGASSTSSTKGMAYWIGLTVLLLVMVFAARKAGGEEDFRNIRPTFYNFLAITLTAIVGIVGLKTIFSKYRIDGLSDVILAA